jgi:hypothetical protein
MRLSYEHDVVIDRGKVRKRDSACDVLESKLIFDRSLRIWFQKAMLQLSVLFVVLYCFSLIWFKMGWKRWLFWIVLIALPAGILSILFLLLAFSFSAAPADLPDPEHLEFFMGAQSAYFALILILCESVRWASIGVVKAANRMAGRRFPRVRPVLATGLVLLAAGGLIGSLNFFFGANPAVSLVSGQALTANQAAETKTGPHPLASPGQQTNASDWNPNGGWLRLRLIDADGTRRFFVSYRGHLIELYFGWKPSGSFGIALRKAQARLVTGKRIGNHKEDQQTKSITCWNALLYLETPQSGYHPTWPAWLRSLGWWMRNPFPGLTEFWLGLTKPIDVYQQIGNQWRLTSTRPARPEERMTG